MAGDEAAPAQPSHSPGSHPSHHEYQTGLEASPVYRSTFVSTFLPKQTPAQDAAEEIYFS